MRVMQAYLGIVLLCRHLSNTMNVLEHVNNPFLLLVYMLQATKLSTANNF